MLIGYARVSTQDQKHFHIVMSANAAGDARRTRLSKAQFADIQHRREQWVLEHHPELEQKAVFYPNQSQAERQARSAAKDARGHISRCGEKMKRRGGHTTERDEVQERLAEIFESARDPRHFAELMDKAVFALYTRGNTHGVTDKAGNKYRLARLGLADAWHALDARMTAQLQAGQAQSTPHHQSQTTTKTPPAGTEAPQPTTESAQDQPAKNAQEIEAEKRLAEIRERRAQAGRQTGSKSQDRER